MLRYGGWEGNSWRYGGKNNGEIIKVEKKALVFLKMKELTCVLILGLTHTMITRIAQGETERIGKIEIDILVEKAIMKTIVLIAHKGLARVLRQGSKIALIETYVGLHIELIKRFILPHLDLRLHNALRVSLK